MPMSARKSQRQTISEVVVDIAWYSALELDFERKSCLLECQDMRESMRKIQKAVVKVNQNALSWGVQKVDMKVNHLWISVNCPKRPQSDEKIRWIKSEPNLAEQRRGWTTCEPYLIKAIERLNWAWTSAIRDLNQMNWPKQAKIGAESAQKMGEPTQTKLNQLIKPRTGRLCWVKPDRRWVKLGWVNRVQPPDSRRVSQVKHVGRVQGKWGRAGGRLVGLDLVQEEDWVELGWKTN